MNLDIMKYEKVNYDNFTNANWIKMNGVPPESIKILLQRFNISSDVINKRVPIVNSQINEGRITASGQPYFIVFYDNQMYKLHFIM